MRLRTCIAVGLISITTQLCAKGESPAAPRQPRPVSYCDIAHDPAAYNHKFLRITASVTHGFEDFHLVDPSCSSDGFSVWVTYGGKAESNTAYCCPGEPGRGERPKTLRIDGIDLPLVRDDVFKQFTNLLAQEPDITVHATLIGTFFSGRKQTIRGHTFWGGAGHLGCCSLFVVERVVNFHPHSSPERVVTVTVAQSNMRPSDSELKKEHTAWAASVLRSIGNLKVGMARSDLLKIFTTEGGLSTTSQRTYVLRQCPYIKVDVKFAAARPDQELPTDKIIEISKPYLAWSVFD